MSAAPIGVFDSGLGGLSILRALRAQLPSEDFLYFSDSGHCPYGGKSAEEIVARSSAVTETLLDRGAKLIVVACNTATVAAVEPLRASYPLSFVGVEPALKPAVAATRSGVIGVLATGAALAGDRFHRLAAQHGRGVRVLTQPCPGLVEYVERGELDGPELRALLSRYLQPLARAGVDVIVLGCTHYPFLKPAIQALLGDDTLLLDTGEAVARQVRRVLERDGLLAGPERNGTIEWLGSGNVEAYATAREGLMSAPL